MKRTEATHCTGLAICCQQGRISQASCPGACTLWTTGTAGVAIVIAAMSSARRSPAGFISVVWKGALTGSGIARFAPVLHAPIAREAHRVTRDHNRGSEIRAATTSAPAPRRPLDERVIEPEHHSHRALPTGTASTM
jgi:hypothetical protein